MSVRAYVLAGGMAAALTGLFFADSALARVESRSSYTKMQTYNGALRYLRVDLGFEVTERDPDAAYLLFDYQSPGAKERTPGSIEIIESSDDVRIFVQLPRKPRYHEKRLSEGLSRKLRKEYGKPPPKAPRRDPPIADAGAD